MKVLTTANDKRIEEQRFSWGQAKEYINTSLSGWSHKPYRLQLGVSTLSVSFAW